MPISSGITHTARPFHSTSLTLLLRGSGHFLPVIHRSQRAGRFCRRIGSLDQVEPFTDVSAPSLRPYGGLLYLLESTTLTNRGKRRSVDRVHVCLFQKSRKLGFVLWDVRNTTDYHFAPPPMYFDSIVQANAQAEHSGTMTGPPHLSICLRHTRIQAPFYTDRGRCQAS